MKKLISLLFMFLFFAGNVYASDIRFAQITDVRFSPDDEQSKLKSVINDINSQPDIDFVVFTGDNIQKVDKDCLIAFIKEAKKLKKPFYVLIGDKDVNKHKDLSKKQYAHILRKYLRNYKREDINYTFEKGGVVFFVVDGAKDVIPSTNGYFKQDVLEWVDANLDLYPKKNVVILQHFPLIPPAESENYITLKTEKYMEIIRNHPNVKAVVSGHFGVNKEINENGVVHISTGALPNYRIIDIIDATSENPTIWAEIKTVE